NPEAGDRSCHILQFCRTRLQQPQPLPHAGDGHSHLRGNFLKREAVDQVEHSDGSGGGLLRSKRCASSERAAAGAAGSSAEAISISSSSSRFSGFRRALRRRFRQRLVAVSRSSEEGALSVSVSFRRRISTKTSCIASAAFSGSRRSRSQRRNT